MNTVYYDFYRFILDMAVPVVTWEALGQHGIHTENTKKNHSLVSFEWKLIIELNQNGVSN